MCQQLIKLCCIALYDMQEINVRRITFSENIRRRKFIQCITRSFIVMSSNKKSLQFCKYLIFVFNNSHDYVSLLFIFPQSNSEIITKVSLVFKLQ